MASAVQASLIAAMAAGVSLLAPAAAASTLEEEGLWYFDWYKVQDQHDAGVTGEGVTIAMIDSPVNLDIPTLQGADVQVQESTCLLADGTPYASESTDFDRASHGTQVLSLLVGSGAGYEGQTGVKGLAPDATVLTYAIPTPDRDGSSDCPGQEDSYGDPLSGSGAMGLAMLDAMDNGADIISVSMGVGFADELSAAMERAIREQVIVVAALPNPGVYDGLGATLPATSNGVVAVGFVDQDGLSTQYFPPTVVAPGASILHQGNEGDWTNQALGTGNSWATPIVSGNLALAMQRHPQATPNQLVQSLIHNTGAEPHELGYDTLHGYGVVITDVFVNADPTEFPDINPEVANFQGEYPLVDEIWGPAAVPNDEWAPEESTRPWPLYTPPPNWQDGMTTATPSPSEPGTVPDQPLPTAAASPVDPDSGGLATGLVIAIIAGVAVLAVVITIIVIVIIRSSRPTGGHHGTP